MKIFKVTYLIDVVSKNPDDYTIKETVEAEDEVDAVKKVAISMTRKDSSNIEWITNLKGDLNEIMYQLGQCGYCFTRVKPLEEIK